MPPKSNMPPCLANTDLLASLATFLDAQEQSFHRDSKYPGVSGMTAYEEDQFFDVLWDSFEAQVILEELLSDRKQATEQLRSHLASQNPSFACSDEAWQTLLEPSAWEFLVHQEFKARGVKDFEVVRVRVEETKTAVVDSHAAHAGAPWTESGHSRKRLYRGHFYGFRQDVLRRSHTELSDKDELTTVNLCDNDHFPIATWAQRGVAGPIFAQ